jgi:hypothetical protein
VVETVVVNLVSESVVGADVKVDKIVDEGVDRDCDVEFITPGNELDDNSGLDSLFAEVSVVRSLLELLVDNKAVTFIILSVAFVAEKVTDVVVVVVGVDPDADDD